MAKKKAKKKTKKKTQAELLPAETGFADGTGPVVMASADVAVAEPLAEEAQLDVNIQGPVELDESRIPEPPPVVIGDVCMEVLMARLPATAEVRKDGDTIRVFDEPDKIKDTLALASRLMLGLRKEGKIKTLPKLIKGE